MLDTGIVDEDVNSPELFGGLIDEVFGISWFGKIGINEFCFDVVAGDLGLNFVDFFLRGESV